MPRWLIVLLVLIGGFFLLSMIAFVALPLIMQGMLPEVGTVLVYEMTDIKPTQNASKVAARTVDMLDRQLNPGYTMRAKIRVIEGNRIEVGIYGDDPSTIKRVSEIMENTGSLEFRIVANVHKHKEEIEIARSDPDKDIYLDSKGEWIVRWIPVKEDIKFTANVNLVRTKKIKDQEVSEVLIVRDPYDITGEYISSARPGFDNGRPVVYFSFNTVGGQLFGTLTGDNLPNGNQTKNQMGIILNGVLYSAPNIQSVIADQGQITGNFTKQEVDQIVGCLNSGSLPVNLRKVEEHKSTKK